MPQIPKIPTLDFEKWWKKGARHKLHDKAVFLRSPIHPSSHHLSGRWVISYFLHILNCSIHRAATHMHTATSSAPTWAPVPKSWEVEVVGKWPKSREPEMQALQAELEPVEKECRQTSPPLQAELEPVEKECQCRGTDFDVVIKKAGRNFWKSTTNDHSARCRISHHTRVFTTKKTFLNGHLHLTWKPQKRKKKRRPGPEAPGACSTRPILVSK